VARQRVGECVAAALPDEKDWTVRCWISRAVAAYSDIPAARAVAIARAVDPSEDEDVRHNCLSGLDGTEPEVVQALDVDVRRCSTRA
jgi:HEAT repeat protein